MTISPVRFFVVVAAIFGLTFLLITPPFQTPDEPVHFYRAYQISQGNLIIDQKGSIAGGVLPRSLERTVFITATKPILQFRPDIKYDIHKTRTALSVKEEVGKKKFYDFSAAAYYSPIAYIPQSAGILVARILHQSPVVMMYSARLFNLATWVFLIALAIKLMPYKKWAVVAVGLLPMAIFDSVSLGADVMMYGLIALILALILKTIHEKRYLDYKYIALILCLLIALSLTKQIAFIFIILVLLIPASLLGKGRNALLTKGILLATPLIIFGIWMAIVGHLNLPNSSDFHPNPPEQIKFIIERPLGYLNVLFRTYFFTPSDGIARSFIGTFGWVDAPLSEIIATIGYIGLTFLLLFSHAYPKKILTKRSKAILLLTIFLYWLAVSTALYIYYDPVKFKTIIGLQGRYFIPIAFLAVPLLYGARLKVPSLFYRRVATVFPLLMLITSTITIFYRYYVTA